MPRVSRIWTVTGLVLLCAAGREAGAQPRREVTSTVEAWPAAVGWPAALPVPEIQAIPMAGVLHERLRYRDGVAEIRVRGSGATDLLPIWQRWTDAIRRAGGHVENEHADPWEASGTVCPGDCARGRYFAALTRDSWLWLTLRETARRPPAAPGACVPIPADRWRICWTTARSSSCSLALHTHWDLDLDRDGIPDARVPQPRPQRPETTCPEDVEWDLYLSRGGCGHRVGHVRGEVSRWRAARAETAGGLVVLATDVEPPGPWAAGAHLRHEYAGGAYRTVRETRDTARCDVHPADCEEIHPTVCAVRDHPTLRGPFDAYDASSRMTTLAEEAQRTCGAGLRPQPRCEVDLHIQPNGTVADLRVRGCGRARACVERVYRAASFMPFSGEPMPIGSSFLIPAPAP